MKRIAALVLVATLALTAGTTTAAAQAPDKNASALLAGAVKQAMQKKLKGMVKGLKVTKVTCRVPKKAKSLSGKCTARFSVTRVNLNGVYRVSARMNGSGVLNWSTSSVTCTDSRTKKPVAC
jgi:hypothetical protein